MSNKLIKILLLLFFTSPVFGQQKSDCNYGYWISGGIGSSYFGLAFKTNLAYSYDNNFFSIRYSKADEFQWMNATEPPLKYREWGILYGRSMRQDYLVLSISAGIGHIWGINRGDLISGTSEYTKISISTISIPIEAVARVEIGNFTGIGFLCYGTLNKDKTFFGGMIELYIGRFR